MASTTSRGARLAIAAAIGAVIGGAAVAGVALAHDDPMPKNPSPATRAAYVRHENFEKLGKTFKGLNDELRKGSPDVAVVKSSTQTMLSLANSLPTWFPRGSGVEARPMSEAKADIWTDAAGFTAAASALQVQVSKLNQAAASGDIAAVKAQVRPTGGACKGCHDKYRQEKKS
ncbi:cytochrome c [Phenylobacterium sp.]|uniref:c-type cytochrome n=1 Tax=Phenylobacterium sp. TaxID=1871053 RepID=UPI0025CD70AC|nr:cytochrome c [Phenylobacterium sp.]